MNINTDRYNELGDLCPVCGVVLPHGPAYEPSGAATYNICISCGTEFGNDDSYGEKDMIYDDKHILVLKELRHKWLESGKPQFAQSHGLYPIPTEIKINDQLKNLPQDFL